MESAAINHSGMKITAGLGSVDDYPMFVKAGADELFCGYVPESWMLRHNAYHPLNRREVRYYNVQIGSESELQILREMVNKLKVPVAITLNALFFEPDDYPLIKELVERCVKLGFDSFIVADPILLVELQTLPDNIKNKVKIHISGEMSEINHEMIRMWNREMVTRVIFHRNTTLSDMKTIIEKNAYDDKRRVEYEAFLLNERCQYHGAYCNSLHCDELAHMCRVPYQFVMEKEGSEAEIVRGAKNEKEYCDTMQIGQPGESGCGLCALWKMKESGVHYLKVVSRGNYAEDTFRDIKMVKDALCILDASECEEKYKKEIKSKLFMEKCSGNCYYWKQ